MAKPMAETRTRASASSASSPRWRPERTTSASSEARAEPSGRRASEPATTRTAEGRAQATLVGALPVPLLLVLDRLDPTFLKPLFDTLRGHLVLGAATLLWLVAVVWARRIVAVDV